MNQTTITDANGKIFSQETFTSNSPKGPALVTLKSIVEKYMKENSDKYKQTKLSNFFKEMSVLDQPKDWDLKIPFHVVIFTVPYTPKLQPIELIWHQVKSAVAKQFELKRTIDNTAMQLKEAFKNISKKTATDTIHHTRQFINDEINANPELKDLLWDQENKIFKIVDDSNIKSMLKLLNSEQDEMEESEENVNLINVYVSADGDVSVELGGDEEDNNIYN